MKELKILMFGWEFPPFYSGGLGVACKGLVKALCGLKTKVIFVLPKKIDNIFLEADPFFYKFIFADEFKNLNTNLKIKAIDSLLSPYITSQKYQHLYKEFFLSGSKKNIYSPNLLEEVLRYGDRAVEISLEEEFDIIHAHDWLSFPAGIEAKKNSGKPLIAHIHATEFDRTGGLGVNQQVYEIEKQGFEAADKIIAVSKFTKNKVVEHYGINPNKITVIYNGIEQWGNDVFFKKNFEGIKKGGQKIILFLGRITLQKGPDYFLLAAKKVLEQNPNVFFIMAGTGDMEVQIIEEAASMGIADKFLFTGFIEEDNLTELYQMADLYVLPSVSEPFGLTPLEALVRGTPVLVSKQSGVSEVLYHCLKVDFWDIDQMANKILAVLEYNELKEDLSEYGQKELWKFSWQDSAQKCLEVYKEVLN